MKVITKLTAAAVVIVLVTSQVSHAQLSYTFQGPNFTSFAGPDQTLLTVGDSLTGTMTVNNPQLSGVCKGPSQGSPTFSAAGPVCDIAELTFSSGGESLNLSTYAVGNSVVGHWGLEFDAIGNITNWTLAVAGFSQPAPVSIGSSPNFGTETINWLHGGNGTFARIHDTQNYGDGKTLGSPAVPANGTLLNGGTAVTGSWTLIPEPTSAVLLSLGLVTMLGCGRRNRR